MHRNEPCSKLGKVSFHGERRNYTWTQNFPKRDRGRQSKGRGNQKLPPLTLVKAVRSFLGHAGFYRRFIKNFSKIAKPLTDLFQKDMPFVFSELCLEAFKVLKDKLINAPIMIAPDWNLEFEIMCDASDSAVGSVLGQRKDKHFQQIYYASKTLNATQENYTN